MFLITAAIAIVGVLGLAAGLYGLVVSTETSYDSPEDKSKKLKWGRQPRMYVISSCIVLIIAWLSTVVVTVRHEIRRRHRPRAGPWSSTQITGIDRVSGEVRHAGSKARC